MSHLLSINSNKGKAINELKNYANKPNIKIIGLGDSPNDLPLLLNSDYKIVIPSPGGPNNKIWSSDSDLFCAASIYTFKFSKISVCPMKSQNF